MGKKIVYVFLACVFLCPSLAISQIKVTVSIPPQKYFVERIGGSLVDVSVLIRPDADPHTYEPKPKQMVEISGSSIYFAVGVPFEYSLLEKIKAENPRLKIVPTQKDIMLSPIESEHGHHHNANNHHDREIKDPHVWLSPPLVMLQARSILSALMEADSENHKVYQKNYIDFIKEIATLDMEIQSMFSDIKAREFLVFHPAWGYFAEAYGLKQMTVEAHGKEPGPKQLMETIRRAKERGIKAIFVQPQISSRSAEIVAKEIGARIVLADPLAEDWARNLRKVAMEMKQAFSNERTGH